MYEVSSKAAASCFPNVAQQSVSADDVENLYGRGGIEELKKTLPSLGLGKAALAASCFNPIKPKPSIPKPVLGQNLQWSGTLPTSCFRGMFIEAELGAFWRDLRLRATHEIVDL